MPPREDGVDAARLRAAVQRLRRRRARTGRPTLTDGSLTIDGNEQAYRAFLDAAATDDNVVGVVLSGSRGAGMFVTAMSDFDVFVIVRRADDRWPYVSASSVEMVALTLEDFESYGLPGGRDAWNRPAFLFAHVEIDKLDGVVNGIVDRKRRLTPDEAQRIAGESLDDYINALYRSLRNFEAGRDLEGHLDAIESLSPLLATAFALDGRVRPFNKWLRYDLGREPPTMDRLLELVERIAHDPRPDLQRAMFREVERHARARNQGAGVDSWEPYVRWLRGEAGTTPD